MGLSVRTPAVAGLFYPDQPQMLDHMVSELVTPLLTEAANSLTAAAANNPPKALIVPHAGYQYSGAVAGHVYATLQPVASQIKRVVLLGPSHRIPLWDLALPQADTFVTPLGEIAIDQQARAQLDNLPQVTVSAEAHAWEHSLEVQLPFLQHCLPEFTLVPLVVGETEPEKVAEVLERLWGGPETLLVFSSDLSHFLSYSQACRRDLATCALIEHLQGPLSGDQACGCMAINGLLTFGKQRHLHIHCLEYCNSGDTAGEKKRVVGYGGYLVYES